MPWSARGFSWARIQPRKKSTAAESRRGRRGVEGHKRTVEMLEAVEPTIRNFKSQKNAARAEHTVNLSKGVILEFCGLQMVEHEDGDGGRKNCCPERERAGIALNHLNVQVARVLPEDRYGFAVVFDTRHERGPLREFTRGRAPACAQLQNMLAECRSVKKPGQQSAARDRAPEHGPAKPVL